MKGPSAHDLATALGRDIDRLARHLLGDPNPKHSTRQDWRFGSKGSISVIVDGDKQGSCFNHEKREGGDALWFVQQCNSGSVRDAMDWAISWLGGSIDVRPEPVKTAPPVARSAAPGKDHTERAIKIWQESREIAGSLVEVYLRHRCAWPSVHLEDLRFHAQCPFGQDRSPAMVALMRNITTGEPQGIHRTELKPDGTGHTGRKMMLGSKTHAAIMLSSSEDVREGLGIAEGIENAATMIANAWAPVWSVCDAGGMEVFPILDGVTHLTIFSDADDKGRGIEAARNCASRWYRGGRAVTIHTPPPGKDWNKVAQERAA